MRIHRRGAKLDEGGVGKQFESVGSFIYFAVDKSHGNISFSAQWWGFSHVQFHRLAKHDSSTYLRHVSTWRAQWETWEWSPWMIRLGTKQVFSCPSLLAMLRSCMHSMHSMHSRAHVRYTSATTTQTLNSVFATLNQHPLWRTMSHHVTPLYPTGSQSKWSLSTRSPLASTGGPSLARWTCLEPRSRFLFKAAVFFVTLCYASLDHNNFLDNLAYLGPTRDICSCIWLESLEWFEAWSSWAHRHCYVRNKLSREEQAVCRSCIGRTGGNWERTWKNMKEH